MRFKLNDIVSINDSNISGKIVDISEDNFGIEVITILTKSFNNFYKYLEVLKSDISLIWEK